MLSLQHAKAKERGLIMATRTAPEVNGTPTFIRVGMSFIDATGDKTSVSTVIDSAATDAEIEALVAAMQTPSNASIYEVRVESIYTSIASSANADEDSVHESIYANTVFLAKNGSQSENLFLPAPEDDTFVDGNTDTPAWDNAQLSAIRSAWVTLLGAGWGVASMRFTERKEINKRVFPK